MTRKNENNANKATDKAADKAKENKATHNAAGEEMLNEKNIETIIKYVEKEQSNDPEIIGIIGALSGAALSVGADLIFGDDDKSALEIATSAATHGIIAGASAYAGAKFFKPKDNSVISMASIGLGAAIGTVAVGKLGGHFLSDNPQESAIAVSNAPISLLM